MFERYKNERSKSKYFADLLARLAWFETEDAVMTSSMIGITVDVYGMRDGHRTRLAQGIGCDMLEALDDVLEIRRRQEGDV